MKHLQSFNEDFNNDSKEFHRKSNTSFFTIDTPKNECHGQTFNTIEEVYEALTKLKRYNLQTVSGEPRDDKKEFSLEALKSISESRSNKATVAFINCLDRDSTEHTIYVNSTKNYSAYK